MLKAESIWIRNTLERIRKNEEFNSLLNIGSSTLEFRKNIQPYVHENIFEPLDKAHIKVTHLDLKKEEGVDIVGDLTNPDFAKEVSAQHYDCSLCSNLLEHLSDRKPLLRAFENIVPEGGYLIITVPNTYPYHPDPIDTMFRPDVDQLFSEFSGFELVEGTILQVDDTYWRILAREPKRLLLYWIKLWIPFLKGWKYRWQYFFKLNTPIKATCVLLRKL